MSPDTLRELLADLHTADEERQCLPRDTAEFEQATDRVYRLAQAVWREAADPVDVGDPSAGRRAMDL